MISEWQERQTAAMHLETIYTRFPEYAAYVERQDRGETGEFPDDDELRAALRVWLSAWKGIIPEYTENIKGEGR